jgi:diguanylate cyclase (GGDEF)-like protein
MPPDLPPDSNSRPLPGAIRAPSELARDELDPLTGLSDRASFLARLHSLIRHTAPEREVLAVVLMKLDGHAAISDRHGQGAGDAALVEFARRIRAAARKVDACARLDVDEIAVILPHVTARDVAERVERRLCEAAEAPLRFEHASLVIAASSGLAMYPDDGSDPVALLDCADRAMAAARARRRATR